MQVVARQLQGWLERYNQKMRILEEQGFVLTPAAAREGLATLTALITEVPEMQSIIDDEVGDGSHRVPIRLYHPQPDRRLPILIYLHGGGHMAGSVEVYDPICRKLALSTGHLVLSVEYRLAPEYPYPAAIDDSRVVIRHFRNTLDRLKTAYLDHLSIAGDSAGGAIAATLAHESQFVSEMPINRQVLIYPSLDYTLCQRSINTLGTGYLLQKEKVRWYFDQYLQRQEDREAASPLFMKCSEALPATMVITAGFCPLRDEGLAYVNRLKARGVQTNHLHLADMIHAYLNMESLTREACSRTYKAIGDFLQLE